MSGHRTRFQKARRPPGGLLLREDSPSLPGLEQVVKPFRFPAQPYEYKIQPLRECPTPDALQSCETPQNAADYWRLHIPTHPYAYTRRQAIADGQQIDVTKTAQESGIRFPMFLTRAVFENYVAVPEGVTGQDEAGRLWDLVWMTRIAILRSRPGADRIPVILHVRNREPEAGRVQLVAICSALDIDDPQPAITLMMERED